MVVVAEGERSVVMVAGAACGIVVIAEAIGDSVVSIGCGNRLAIFSVELRYEMNFIVFSHHLFTFLMPFMNKVLTFNHNIEEI